MALRGRRYRWDAEKKEMVEITGEEPTPMGFGLRTSEGELYDGARTTDGVDISTRKKRREYFKATGTTDVSDYKEQWAKQAEERRAHFAGERDVSNGRRREQLGRMLYNLGRKP